MLLGFGVRLLACRFKHDINGNLDPAFSCQVSGITVFYPFADGTYGKEFCEIRSGNLTIVDSIVESVTKRGSCLTQIGFLVCANRYL